MTSDNEADQANATVDGVVATCVGSDNNILDRWFPTAFDPRKAACRYAVLGFICFLNFGNYMVYDTPAALSDNIIQDMKVTTSSYNLLYDIYSWPNIILAFFAGILVDNVCGVRLGGVIFSLIVLIAQVTVALGAFTGTFELMVVGRGIFALGGESLTLVQNIYLVKWFSGKELNFVFGFALSFGRVGSTITLNIMKPIYAHVDQYAHGHLCLGITMFVAAGFALFSWICSLMLVVCDRRRERFSAAFLTVTIDPDIPEPIHQPDKVRCVDLLHLSPKFWLLCFICVTYYASVFPFVSNALLFFIRKYGLSPYNANLCNSLIYIVSTFSSPLFGIAVDKLGRNVVWMLLSISLALIVHVLFAFTFLIPYGVVALSGISYSLLASSLWPCISYVAASRVLATAYGIMASVQNLGLALVYLYIGSLVDHYGYFLLELHFITLLSISFVLASALFALDISTDQAVSMSAEARRLLHKS